MMLARADGEDDAGALSGPDDHVLRPGGAVHEVPLPQRPLLALDDEQSLAGEHEEVFLIGFPVVHRHRLTRPEHTEADSDLREVRLTLEGRLGARPSRWYQRAARAFRTNHPSPAATSPCSVCSSGASGTIVRS